MSAFVVDDNTINRIVSWLHMKAKYGHYPFEYCPKPLIAMGYRLDDPLGCKRLAEEMFTLNCDAVEQRYGEGEAEKFRPLDFHWQFNPHQSNALSCLKALRCWLYQCSEGDAPQSALYKAMDALCGDIALAYVESLPEYEKAPMAH